MSLSKAVIFETTFNYYTGTDIIGEGGAGHAYLATDDAENVYAIKLLDAAKANREKVKRFKNEVEFSLRNRHPNIITIIDHGVFIDGKEPEQFHFSDDTASNRAAEHDVQQIIDYFKMWLPIANREYEQTIRREQQEEEERQRQELQKEIEEQERRQRVRANVRI